MIPAIMTTEKPRLSNDAEDILEGIRNSEQYHEFGLDIETIEMYLLNDELYTFVIERSLELKMKGENINLANVEDLLKVIRSLAEDSSFGRASEQGEG